MGIPYLNRFLKKNCTDSIKTIDLSSLSGKKIVVDISIYLHKFNLSGSIIDGLYQFVTIFRKANILPIFVFDGCAPEAKKKTIQRRKRERDVAQIKCNQLEEKLKHLSGKEKMDALSALRVLRRRAASLPSNAYEIAKEFASAAGLEYYQATSEADIVCAKLVNSGEAWACLSDDMDMFAYGCNSVLRGLNFQTQLVYHYSYTNILNELNISSDIFRMMCCICENDYSSNTGGLVIDEIYNMAKNSATLSDFLNHFTTHQQKSIQLAYSIYDIENISSISDIAEYIHPNVDLYAKPYRDHLREHDFIFKNPQ